MKTRFNIVHVHGNNNTGTLKSNLPITLEVTMANKRNFSGNENHYNFNFPIKNLDYPNNLDFDDVEFSFKNNDTVRPVNDRSKL
tara:strand:+ start:143 stop:394 length:252 start_codon:yes stop_codon:yes gene_type:complete